MYQQCISVSYIISSLLLIFFYSSTRLLFLSLYYLISVHHESFGTKSRFNVSWRLSACFYMVWSKMVSNAPIIASRIQPIQARFVRFSFYLCWRNLCQISFENQNCRNFLLICILTFLFNPFVSTSHSRAYTQTSSSWASRAISMRVGMEGIFIEKNCTTLSLTVLSSPYPTF